MGEENHNLCCVFFQILPNLHDLYKYSSNYNSQVVDGDRSKSSLSVHEENEEMNHQVFHSSVVRGIMPKTRNWRRKTKYE